MQRPWMCALVALALLGAPACIGGGGDDDVPSAREASMGQFGGELEGTDALIGIVVGKERVTVYACDDGTIWVRLSWRDWSCGGGDDSVGVA